MKYLKLYEELDIDPFGEEEWDEVDELNGDIYFYCIYDKSMDELLSEGRSQLDYDNAMYDREHAFLNDVNTGKPLFFMYSRLEEFLTNTFIVMNGKNKNNGNDNIAIVAKDEDKYEELKIENHIDNSNGIHEDKNIDFNDWDEEEIDPNSTFSKGDIVVLKDRTNCMFTFNNSEYSSSSRKLGEEFRVTRTTRGGKYFKCKSITDPMPRNREIPFADMWYVSDNFTEFVSYESKLYENIDFDEEEWEEEEDGNDWDMFHIKKYTYEFGLFTKFLNDNDVDVLFLESLKSSKDGTGYIKNWDDVSSYFNFYNPRDWILQSFSWRDNIKGVDFWNKLNKKWKGVLNVW